MKKKVKQYRITKALKQEKTGSILVALSQEYENTQQIKNNFQREKH